MPRNQHTRAKSLLLDGIYREMCNEQRHMVRFLLPNSGSRTLSKWLRRQNMNLELSVNSAFSKLSRLSTYPTFDILLRPRSITNTLLRSSTSTSILTLSAFSKDPFVDSWSSRENPHTLATHAPMSVAELLQLKMTKPSPINRSHIQHDGALNLWPWRLRSCRLDRPQWCCASQWGP